jgi:hypothetical protein
MKTLARGIVGCLLLSAALSGAAQFKRISAAEFAKSPARVSALKRAVSAMKSRSSLPSSNKLYRTSWTYWANTHGYFGTGPNSSGPASAFKAQASQICAGLPPSQFSVCTSYYAHVKDSTLPNDGVTANVWGMCQHSDPSLGPSQANMQFFTWHRMYLKYFERVLRKASGDPNFTLPYWNYPDNAGPRGTGIALPTMMRGTATNTLVDTFRTPGLNANTTAISSNTGSAVQAFKFNDFRNFSFQLEMQPHGSMHCGTGFGCQAPDIGIVPVAGNDPVFYMHHANIDRLFQCWLVRKAAGKPITLAWAKANLGMPDSFYAQTWNFVDENGDPVSMTVAQLFEPGGIDYTYDQVTNCVPARITPEAVAASARPAANEEDQVLRGAPLSVQLSPVTLEAPEGPLPEGVTVDPGRTVLLIEDVRVAGSPGVTYDIYMSRKDAPDRRAYVATINYFNILVPHHAAHIPADAPRGHKLLFYDVTEQLAEIGGNAESDVSVDFVPTRSTEEEAAVSANAGTVTVGAVRLRVAQ